MLRDALLEIMEKYPIVRNENFSGNAFADFFRHELPELFKSYFPERTNLIWDASVGQGQWADAPWIAIFNPLVTESAQNGYYPVYLFSYNLDKVYLSLNQGMTSIKQEFSISKIARETLMHRSEIMRSKLINEYEEIFKSTPINLESDDPNSRLAWYEPGNVFSKEYKKDKIPSNEVLISDLQKMLDLYDLVIARGGILEHDHLLETEEIKENKLKTVEEKRKYRYHRLLERNSRNSKEVKKIHGYVCEVCGFDFEIFYGPLGHEFIEAHHKVPISKLPDTGKIVLSIQDDFVVLCSNCHSMVHKREAPETFEQFKNKIVNKRINII